MAAGSWVRSFHCKSTAAGDVAAAITALPKKPHHLLLPRSSCASSGDAHRNVSSSSAKAKPQSSSKQSSPAKKAKKHRLKAASVPPSPPPGPLGPVPALTELPAGHSSRQVVEIIFLSSWSPLPAAQHLPAALASAGVGGVIAGRVADGPAASDADADAEPVPSKEYDSVRAGKGELIVFDRRAVLPCFLIIYKL
uniref:Uncharacterized protein n=1 Tax=Oryza brachyantha TaxID=4533 RepID=J3LFI8_ORYBR